MKKESKKFRLWAAQHRNTVISMSLSTLAKKFGLSTVGIWKINKEFNIKTAPILIKKFCIHGHDISIVGRTKDGKCKECKRAHIKRTYVPHPRKLKRFCKRGHDLRKVGRYKGRACKQCAKENYHKNRIIRLQQMKKYREENKEYFAIKRHEYYLVHKAELLEQTKKWREENKEILLPKRRKYLQILYATDIQYRIAKNLRRRLKLALEGNFKTGSAIKDLGCTIEFLTAYLQNKFYGKMTWDNYGTYWEIDHVNALWKFDLTKREEFLMAVNFTNLQPLTKPDHQKKTIKELKERNKIYARSK